MKLLLLVTAILISGCKSSGPPEGSMVFDSAPSVKSTRVRFETSPATREHARQSGLPVLLSGEASKYPDNVSREKIGNGWVQLTIDIDATGQVSGTTVLDSSNSVFHDAAIAAARTWTFEPFGRSTSITQRLFFNAGIPAPDAVPADIQ